MLVVGFEYITGTFAINFPQDDVDQPTFSVLSYNTSFLQRREFEGNVFSDVDTSSSSYKIIDWIVENDADIKCFQEFYHKDSSEMFSTLDLISENGEYDYYFSSKYTGWEDADFGIVIFSRFPIVNSGEVIFKEGSVNRAAFADIIVQKDTIRFINVHLQSMSLGSNNPLKSETLESTKQDLKTLYKKFTKGLIDRSFQAEVIMELIQQSPYKVILVGDFNQTPYSFVYNSFKNVMNNAFEKAGNGFGVTYSGNTLFFLRIDNQFYDPALKAVDYKTHYDMPYSDHFPIQATYMIPGD